MSHKVTKVTTDQYFRLLAVVNWLFLTAATDQPMVHCNMFVFMFARARRDQGKTPPGSTLSKLFRVRSAIITRPKAEARSNDATVLSP